MRLFFFFAILFISACNSYDGKTDSNYPYKFHIDEAGESPQVGDKVIFHEQVFKNGEMIFSTDGLGEKEIILPLKENLSKPLPPNYEILFKMSPGDSVSVIQDLGDLENLPEGYKTSDELKYVVKLSKIIPKSEFKNPKKKGVTSSNNPYEFFGKKNNLLAQVGDQVTFREYVYLNDSLLFESTFNKPIKISLPPKDSIRNPPPGNYDALTISGIGDSIHLDQLLTEMKNLPRGISPNDTLKYRIKVIDILTPAEVFISKKIKKAEKELAINQAKARKLDIEKMTLANLQKYKNGELENDLIVTHSDLEYFIHKKGKGKMPNPTQNVKVHYSGFLMDGTPFDSSFDRGEPYEFSLGMGRVIKAWDEGISKLPVGSQATFFVPFKLAYGMMGRPPKIPQRADLVFYVEVVDAE